MQRVTRVGPWWLFGHQEMRMGGAGAFVVRLLATVPMIGGWQRLLKCSISVPLLRPFSYLVHLSSTDGNGFRRVSPLCGQPIRRYCPLVYSTSVGGGVRQRDGRRALNRDCMRTASQMDAKNVERQRKCHLSPTVAQEHNVRRLINRTPDDEEVR